MRSFLAATVAATAAAHKIHYRDLMSDKEFDSWNAATEGEKLLGCSAAVGLLVMVLCPDNYDDCDEDVVGGAIALSWDSLTSEEKQFWDDCGSIFDAPDEACNDLIGEMLADDCQLLDTVGDCFDKGEDEFEELKDEEKGLVVVTLAVTVDTCEWEMDNPLWYYYSGATALAAAAVSAMALLTF